jgi:predicted PurR-regulated permease PerM
MPTPSRTARYVFIVAMMVLIIGFSLGLVQPFIRPAIYAVIVAIGCHPLYQRLRKHVRTPSRAALLMVLGVLCAVVVPLLVITTLTSGEIVSAAQYLKGQSAAQGGLPAYVAHLKDNALAWMGQYVNIQNLHLEQRLGDLPSRAGDAMLEAGKSLARFAVASIVNGIVTMLFLFFFFRDGDRWLHALASVIPLSEAGVKRLFKVIEDSVIANLYGILGVAVGQGLLTTIGLLIAGVGSPLLLGLVASACSVIPVVGTSLVWGPASVYLFLTGHTGKGIFMLIWGFLVVSGSDNIIRPMLVFGRVELHPLLLIVALIGGFLEFGFLGLFIGPVLISILVVLIKALHDDLLGITPAEAAAAPAT